jgi:L-iditol 2-dehydrogenase
MKQQTMHALRYYGNPELILEEMPLPEPPENWVRVRPQAVGIDGTDGHVLAGEFPADIPIIPGHEIAGAVDAIGKNVTKVHEGDLVCIEPHVYCTKCRYCVSGREHLCVDKKAFGFRLNGGLAEAIIVPERVVYQVPKGLSPEIGALAEPVSCCVHGMDRLEPVSGMGIAIFGAGTAGVILLKLARLAGLSPIISIEPQADRRKIAKDFGADLVFDPTEAGWKEKAIQATGGSGFDYLIDAVGSGKIIENALTMTARGARLMVFGVAKPEDIARINPYLIFREELSIFGSVINPYTHQRAVELLPRLDLHKLPIHSFPLTEYQAAYSHLGHGGKVIITPQVLSAGKRKEA